MADYYPLLAREVSRLGNNTPEAREELYERARRALTDLAASSELERERRSLELAILQIECDASASQSTGSRTPETGELKRQSGSIHPMHAFLAACITAVVLAILGYYALSLIQQPVSEAFSTQAVRLN